MIELVNVSKKLQKKQVLKNISYSFERGKIYGIVGRNGSGKTMLLRSIAGLIIPTEGIINVDNKQLHKDLSFPPSMGIIIENMQMLPQLTAYRNLEMLSKIKKLANDKDIETSLMRVGLEESRDVKVKKFSLGMKQRLNIAQAVFEKPDLILLDEPTNAVDENGISLINNLLMEEKKRGATIIIASHLKDDLASVCDKIIQIDQGMIING
ncbi:ABC transporter ATP-binding protein [Terribacillus saccharophilus]|uniref:ABC transporter ATP-binding protein n=1 Tax=Terribacillus saccharophilus TaxID=361277 RepID=UPI002989FB0A|nr:ABC transporter ATP-binding protein [Terribacillus saccharophilus]MCM3225966.1 ABC transporter ATP-binding protein [Terribacillus saccharophilus]